MNIQTKLTRRAALAGTAALPALALASPAATETDDPAIAAAARWIVAMEAEAAYATPDGINWEDDPHTAELETAIETRLRELVKTPPINAAGLALTLAAFTFAEHGEGIRMRFDQPDNRWGGFSRDGRRDLVAAVWSSPAAAELFPKLGRSAAPVAAALPVAAVATEDPAVAAFHVWRDAWKAHGAFCYSRDDWADDDPEENRLRDAEWAARKALVETVATTPAGIACQIRVAFDLFHDQSSPDADIDRPESYSFNGWADDIEGKLLRNMLTAAERLAGRAAA